MMDVVSQNFSDRQRKKKQEGGAGTEEELGKKRGLHKGIGVSTGTNGMNNIRGKHTDRRSLRHAFRSFRNTKAPASPEEEY